MKNIAIKALATSIICFMSFGVANAAPEKAKSTKSTKTQKAKAKTTKAKAQNATSEERLQVNACTKKKQGEWASYSFKGVTFNGTCEPGESGKLQFQAPTPGASAAAPATAPVADTTTAPASAPVSDTTTAPAAATEPTSSVPAVETSPATAAPQTEAPASTELAPAQ